MSIWHRIQTKDSNFREVDLNDVYSPYYHLPRVRDFPGALGLMGIHPLVNLKSQPLFLSVCQVCVCYAFYVFHCVYHVCLFSSSIMLEARLLVVRQICQSTWPMSFQSPSSSTYYLTIGVQELETHHDIFT